MAITLHLLKPVSDEDLLELSQRNLYQLERRRDGALIVTMVGKASSARTADLTAQVASWSQGPCAGPVFGSSAGFHLADGSVLSPDTSWMQPERWETLTRPQQEGFPPLCPDAVFEIRVPTDAIEELHAKMRLYLDNGARLAVLIDPFDRFVELWRPEREPDHFAGEHWVAMDPELPGLVLEVDSLYA